MEHNFFSWVIKVLPKSNSFYSNYDDDSSDIKFLESWFKNTNEKIKSFGEKGSINFDFYREYFNFIKSFGLQNEFKVRTKNDSINLKVLVIRSILFKSENRNKAIIFCHGVSNNKWSLFYCMHIALQMGYNVITYDARNHGESEKSYTTLGKVESDDLEDIIVWSLNNLKFESLGIYGFSMGASTILHWIGKFQDKHSEVKAVFCEAPFDDFSKRFNSFLAVDKFSDEKDNFEIIDSIKSNKSYFSKIKEKFLYIMAMRILKSPFKLHDIKPINSLPNVIKPKILIMHGLKDDVIDYRSSIEIWKKIISYQENKDNIKLFFVKDALHGDLAILGDFAKDKIIFYDNVGGQKTLNLTFSSIFFSFFIQNL